jgi:hypothetical protein
MTEGRPSDYTWCKRILDGLEEKDQSAKLARFTVLDDAPEWVWNVARELTRQGLPAVPIRDFSEATPGKVGLYLGQQFANRYAIDRLGLCTPEAAKRGEAFVQVLQRNRSRPEIKSLLHALEFLGLGLNHLQKSGWRRLDAAVQMAFKEVLARPSHADALAFFKGFAKGLSRPAIERGRAASATTATPIYFRMFLRWREIEQLQSVAELRRFLITSGVSEQVLGDPKRLEKVCERMGLRLGKRGRPRKREKSDTPPG